MAVGRPRIGHWAWPFIWILVIPAISMLATGLLLWEPPRDPGLGCITEHSRFGFSTTACPGWVYVEYFAPELLNLGPLLWLRGRGAARIAAAIAGGIGALRFVIPMALLQSVDGLTRPYENGETAALLALWALAPIALAAFWAARRFASTQPHSPHPPRRRP